MLVESTYLTTLSSILLNSYLGYNTENNKQDKQKVIATDNSGSYQRKGLGGGTKGKMG